MIGWLAVGAAGTLSLLRVGAAVVRRLRRVPGTGGVGEILYDALRGLLVRTVLRWAAGPEYAERYRQNMMLRRELPAIDVSRAKAALGRYLSDSLHTEPPPAAAPMTLDDRRWPRAQ